MDYLKSESVAFHRFVGKLQCFIREREVRQNQSFQPLLMELEEVKGRLAKDKTDKLDPLYPFFPLFPSCLCLQRISSGISSEVLPPHSLRSTRGRERRRVLLFEELRSGQFDLKISKPMNIIFFLFFSHHLLPLNCRDGTSFISHVPLKLLFHILSITMYRIYFCTCCQSGVLFLFIFTVYGLEIIKTKIFLHIYGEELLNSLLLLGLLYTAL